MCCKAQLYQSSCMKHFFLLLCCSIQCQEDLGKCIKLYIFLVSFNPKNSNKDLKVDFAFIFIYLFFT